MNESADFVAAVLATVAIFAALPVGIAVNRAMTWIERRWHR